VRLRALVFLLVLTVADYLLWNWSIAGGHDIVSLVAGLTLLPLGTVSIAQLALTAARLMGLLLGRPASNTRAKRASREIAASERAVQASAVESDPPSSRLAA
jgi:membrane protein implicated in regulation of membrane protease activity